VKLTIITHDLGWLYVLYGISISVWNILQVLSPPPDANYLEHGENSTDKTASLWPSKLVVHLVAGNTLNLFSGTYIIFIESSVDLIPNLIKHSLNVIFGNNSYLLFSFILSFSCFIY